VVFGDLLDDVGYGKVLGGRFDRSHLRLEEGNGDKNTGV
jgi:hypothetical protein